MRKKGRIEQAARALCRFHGLPENTTIDGRPMWTSYIEEVKAVLQAALTPEEYERLLAPDEAANP